MQLPRKLQIALATLALSVPLSVHAQLKPTNQGDWHLSPAAELAKTNRARDIVLRSSSPTVSPRKIVGLFSNRDGVAFESPINCQPSCVVHVSGHATFYKGYPSLIAFVNGKEADKITFRRSKRNGNRLVRNYYFQLPEVNRGDKIVISMDGDAYSPKERKDRNAYLDYVEIGSVPTR